MSIKVKIGQIYQKIPHNAFEEIDNSETEVAQLSTGEKTAPQYLIIDQVDTGKRKAHFYECDQSGNLDQNEERRKSQQKYRTVKIDLLENKKYYLQIS